MGILYIECFSHGGNMKLKAQNTVELVIMVSLVVVVVISIFMFMGGSTQKMANLSKIDDSRIGNSSSVSIGSGSSTNTVDVETAGALQSNIATMSQSSIERQLASSSAYSYLASNATKDERDIFDLANDLIEECGLHDIDKFIKPIIDEDKAMKNLALLVIESTSIVNQQINKKEDVSPTYAPFISAMRQVMPNNK